MIIICFNSQSTADCFPGIKIFVEVPIFFTLLTVSVMDGSGLPCSDLQCPAERVSYKEVSLELTSER